MPMDFPDLNSLRSAAKIYGFRDIGHGEPEEEFRTALADHVASIDLVESEEIRNKVGWDKWSKTQEKDFLRRQGMEFV